MNLVIQAIGVSLIPFFIVWLAISFTLIKFSKTVATIIQAMAAGFILGSIMIDLMPRVMHHGFDFSYIISFVIGFSFMLIIQQTGGDCCGSKGSDKKSLHTFLVPYGVEFFVTGVLLGIAAVTSTVLVIMIAISFSFCNLICSLSISARLTSKNVSRTKRTSITALLAFLLPLGALISSTTIRLIPMEWVNDLLSFAIACLLSLVLTELFPEAISVHKRRGITVVFCAMTFVFLLYYFIG